MLSGPRGVVRQMWDGPGGGREVLALAYPLILAHMSFTVQTFVDRLFLTWYSAEAVAGAVTGLFTTLAVMALFSRTREDLTTFIAQYLGARRPLRIRPLMWQGLYLPLRAGGGIPPRPPPGRPRLPPGRHP